jgi:hypothetical protein
MSPVSKISLINIVISKQTDSGVEYHRMEPQDDDEKTMEHIRSVLNKVDISVEDVQRNIDEIMEIRDMALKNEDYENMKYIDGDIKLRQQLLLVLQESK